MRAPDGESRARGPGSLGLRGSPTRSTGEAPARGPAAASSVGQAADSRQGSRRRECPVCTAGAASAVRSRSAGDQGWRVHVTGARNAADTSARPRPASWTKVAGPAPGRLRASRGDHDCPRLRTGGGSEWPRSSCGLTVRCGLLAEDCAILHWCPALGGQREKSDWRAPCPLCQADRALRFSLYGRGLRWWSYCGDHEREALRPVLRKLLGDCLPGRASGPRTGRPRRPDSADADSGMPPMSLRLAVPGAGRHVHAGRARTSSVSGASTGPGSSRPDRRRTQH